MKRIIIPILIMIPFIVLGQKIDFKFSSEIQNTKDSSIAAVRDLWKAYVINSKEGFGKPSLDFWNNIELDNGFTDIVKAATTFPTYFGEFQVYDIKKVDNDYYRIRTIWSLDDSKNILIFGIYNVYAKKDSSDYKLYNNLFLIKPKLNHYQVDNIDFYYPNSYPFDQQKANKTFEFYSTISTIYGNSDKRKVMYLIGNNLDEAYNFLGFDYTFWSTPSPFAGKFIESQNIIVSCREDHTHEIVHAVLIPMFPKGHSMLHEGIATYYGGSAGENFPDLIAQLKNTIKSKPNVDLSQIENLDKNLGNGKLNNFYTVGALFIDYALKTGGPKKVLALLQNPVTNPDTFDDDLSAIDKELGIKKDQVDRFLKDYIQNYKNN